MSTIRDRKLGFATRELHAGYSPDPTTGSRAVPLYQTTSYQFKSTEHAANLFALKELGNIYTRLMNPTTDVFPFEEGAEIAKKHKLVLFIDNTFATPYLFRPFEWGAHVITHSTTKFIGGHGTSIGGIIVDGGNYDFSNGKFENFNTPDPSYHGLVYSSLVGAGFPPFAIKARVHVLRDIGACHSPFT